MKKVILVIFAVSFLSACLPEGKQAIDSKINIPDVQEDAVKEQKGFMVLEADEEIALSAEEEFNNSGRAKAIEDETDLWMFYNDEQTGLEVRYPGDVSMGDAEATYLLDIKRDKVAGLEGTMGFDQETAILNQTALEAGEYGESVDFPYEDSKQVRTVAGVNAQDFIVFGRFEVCDVSLDRIAYFFYDGYQYVLTLSMNKDALSAEYLTLDQANCGEEKMWNMEKQVEFFEKLKKGEASEAVQRWYNVFDEIIATAKFEEVSITGNNLNLLYGTWQSADDADSVIEFKADKRISYYAGEEMSESAFQLCLDQACEVIDSSGMFIQTTEMEGDNLDYEINVLDAENLELIYLGQGNTLNYKRVE